jgi:hypothetical protein
VPMENIGSDVKVIPEDSALSQKSREEVCRVAKDPHLIAYILKDLERDVKRDIPSKISSLITDQSAYLPEPLVTALKGPSGVGKTHNVTKSSKYFPKEDVLLLGGLSPKSLIHEHGVLMDANNGLILPEDKPIKPKRRSFPSGDSGTEEYDQALGNYRRELNVWNERNRNSYKLIRLQCKILTFLEAPPQETIRMLLPILSHDTRRIEYRYVEEMETKKAIIEGWPAAIFLSTSTPYMEEMSTRTLTVTPESGVEKIEEANKLTNVQASFPWEYEEEKESTKIIQGMILRIKDKLTTENFGIVVPFL